MAWGMAYAAHHWTEESIKKRWAQEHQPSVRLVDALFRSFLVHPVVGPKKWLRLWEDRLLQDRDAFFAPSETRIFFWLEEKDTCLAYRIPIERDEKEDQEFFFYCLPAVELSQVSLWKPMGAGWDGLEALIAIWKNRPVIQSQQRPSSSVLWRDPRQLSF